VVILLRNSINQRIINTVHRIPFKFTANEAQGCWLHNTVDSGAKTKTIPQASYTRHIHGGAMLRRPADNTDSLDVAILLVDKFDQYVAADDS
jgi:hypothetical protein